MRKDAKIYIAGHRGLAGSSIVRELVNQGYTNLIYRTSQELNLLDSIATDQFFAQEKPEYVFMCAGTVGGILANSTYPVEFTQNNVLMAINTMSVAYKYKVRKFVYLGSSCIYPKECSQPMKEECLLTGLLESTNEGYALAKIVGIKLCEYYRREYNCDFIAVMPSNLYGPNDNYDPENSHVVPALIRRFHEAKERNLSEVVVWGTGTPRREFTYIDDFANGVVFVMKDLSITSFINLGYGDDISVKELAFTIAGIIKYQGKIVFDVSKPDGIKQKLMDSSKIFQTGWKPKTTLEEGLKLSYDDFLKNNLN